MFPGVRSLRAYGGFNLSSSNVMDHRDDVVVLGPKHHVVNPKSPDSNVDKFQE